MRNTLIPRFTLLVLVLVLVAAACAKRQTPVATPQPPPSNAPSTATTTPAPPQVRLPDQLPVPPQPALSEDAVGSKTLDDLNRNSPFKPVFFAVDSADLDEAGRQVASANADILKTNSRWVVTIEGHCDERGTAEYNLALGERRAIAVKTFLVSLGISPERDPHDQLWQGIPLRSRQDG